MSKTKTAFYGWRNLVYLFICYGILYGAVFYGYSVIFPAMIKALKWSRGDASMAHTVRALIVGFGTPLTVYLIGRIGNRWTMVTGSLVCFLSLLLLALLPGEMWSWTLLWGVGMGFGLTLAGQVTMQNTVTLWFSRRRALCIGIVMSAGAVGGMISQPLFVSLMKQTGNWHTGWLAAAIMAFFVVVGVFFLKSKPSDFGQYTDGIDPDQARAAGLEKKAVTRTFRSPYEWTLSEAMRTRSFWCLTIVWCTTNVFQYLILAHGVLHMLDKGYPAIQAAYVISFFAFGGLVRLPIGWLGDIIEPRWIMSVLLVLTVISLFIFWTAPNVTLMIIAAFVMGCANGSNVVLCGAVVGNYYSQPSFVKIQSVIYPVVIGLGAIVPAGVGYLFDVNRNYDLAYMMIMTLTTAAFLAALLMKPPVKDNKVASRA